MSWPPRFLFISGRLAIDFVHTGGEGWRAQWERWGSPRDLAEWMHACPLLAVRATVSRSDLAEAEVLREAIWGAAHDVLRGRAIDSASLSTIHRAALRPSLVPMLRRGTKVWAGGATGRQALSTVARDAIDLFGTEAKNRLRECQRPDCYLLFVDTSRPGKRAWCAMRRCGNLEKIARYRAKSRRADNQPNKEKTK